MEGAKVHMIATTWQLQFLWTRSSLYSSVFMDTPPYTYTPFSSFAKKSIMTLIPRTTNEKLSRRS
jgi:hypothetical protein